MFEGLRFRWRLSHINRTDRKWQRRHQKKIDEARKRGATREELEELSSDSRMYSELIQEEIAKIETRYLMGELNRLRIPQPKYIVDDDHPGRATWTRTDKQNYNVFTPRMMVELRETIRKERKERSEIPRLWLAAITSLLSMVIGLIGVIIGLVAAIYRK